MKLSTKHKIILSLFVILGLGIFIFLIFYIGQNKNLFTDTIVIRSNFKNVSGLNVGNNVRFAGIKVGTISNISVLNDTSILVEAFVDKEYQPFIRTDSKMAIGSEGLMGDKLVDITPGNPSLPNVKSFDHIASVKPINIDAIIGSAQNTLHNIEALSGELGNMAHKINHSDGIFNTLINDKQAAGRMKKTFANLEKGSESLSDNLEAAKHNILFRGYFKKKEKAAKKKQEEAEQEKLEKIEEKEEHKKEQDVKKEEEKKEVIEKK